MCLKLVCLVEHHKVVDITSACLPLYICLYIFIFPGRQGKQQTHIPVSFLISNIGQVAALMIGADKFIAGTLPSGAERGFGIHLGWVKESVETFTVQ